LGIGDWAQSPIPNPQSPIPNPHYIIKIVHSILIVLLKNKNIIIFYLIKSHQEKKVLQERNKQQIIKS
jgi:hypothetical protein